MPGRPKLSPPPWASDDSFVAPGHAWDGGPTKVVPGGSYVAGGVHPTEKPPSEFLNWLWNLYSDHLIHLDAPEPQNWGPQIKMGDIFGSTFNYAPDANATNPVVWDPITRNLWMTAIGFGAAPSKIIRSESGGRVWIDTTFSVGSGLNGIASSASGTGIGYLMACSPLTNWYRRAPTGLAATWTTFAMPGTAGPQFGIAYDVETNRFVSWGQDSLGNCGIFWGTETAGTVAQATVASSVGLGNGQILFVAVAPPIPGGGGSGRKVAIGFVPLSITGIYQSWTSTAVDTPWANRGNLYTSLGVSAATPVGLVYDPNSDLFVLVANEGGGIGGLTYVSADGISWAAKSAHPNLVFLANTLACSGNLWVAIATDPNLPADMMPQTRVIYSKDQGVTWLDVPYPLLPVSGAAQTPFNVTLVDGRFVILAVDTSGDVWTSYSLRLL